MMPQSTSAAAARSLYRSLLRELPPLRPVRAGLTTPRKPIHDALRMHFINGASMTPEKQAAGMALAKEAKVYLWSQRGYVELLNQEEAASDSVNRERAANRVGLKMPSEFYKQ
jgi:hypothetical protein